MVIINGELSTISGQHWIGLRENLRETTIFNGKKQGFRLRFSLNQSNEYNNYNA